MRRPLSHLLDHFIPYLPLFFMALLAGFTWWLVQVSPEPLKVGVKKPPRVDPDYIVHDFVSARFDRSGSLRSWLTGVQMRRYPGLTAQQDKVEVDDIRLLTTEVNAQNKAQPLLDTPGIDFYRTFAKADIGYLIEGREVVELHRNAVVTRQPLLAQANVDKVVLESEELRMLTQENKIISDVPVNIAQNGSWVRSDEAVYDGDTHTLHMQGNVRLLKRENPQ